MAILFNNIIPNKKYNIPHLVHQRQTQFLQGLSAFAWVL